MMRRMFAVAALLASCHAWAGGKGIVKDSEAATKAADITRDYGLSKDKTACLLFGTADKGSYFLIRVRENHCQACGG